MLVNQNWLNRFLFDIYDTCVKLYDLSFCTIITHKTAPTLPPPKKSVLMKENYVKITLFV